MIGRVASPRDVSVDRQARNAAKETRKVVDDGVTALDAYMSGGSDKRKRDRSQEGSFLRFLLLGPLFALLRFALSRRKEKVRSADRENNFSKEEGGGEEEVWNRYLLLCWGGVRDEFGRRRREIANALHSRPRLRDS